MLQPINQLPDEELRVGINIASQACFVVGFCFLPGAVVLEQVQAFHFSEGVGLSNLFDYSTACSVRWTF